ncbi:hypothetical protein PTTG_01350 [Puccinia triticina 1-1 BBBD Race 1]|uniref:protein-tyrosine-phosphatase n=1 Tax=Puccinia triticina (isolate 1-1 / race 1 (BBBD)) TaxID=630390 RepID=A0A180GAE1_PUCT1|nr:hypothetical protein PTTG_01350 [Puccinia triticina 1-1 BBBD Race 1]WAR62720.1 hypothetical protein PtB15_15B307 [Puccinia triticina]
MATTTTTTPAFPSPAVPSTHHDTDRLNPPEERMQQVLPRLFIGDLTAAQSLQALKDSQIRNVVSVIKHSYPHHPGFNHLSVPLDDTERTNICEWFDTVASWIQARLDDPNGYGVLIHCVAGVSRSTTLLAAYLMKAYRLTTDEAVGFIASKRPQVQPNDFFFHQLEMYERCDCEWNPVKYQEQRRFLMSFVADEMKDGAGAQKLILAYYPSPAPSPAEGTSLAMTALKTSSVETKLNTPSLLTAASIASQPMSMSLAQPPARRRLTKKSESSASSGGLTKARVSETQPVVEKLGKGQVVIQGRRLRCKMCRRELAGRDHILFHSPGKGQQAFAPQRQDMAQFRLDQLSPDRKPPATDPPSRPLAGLSSLRIAVPPNGLRNPAEPGATGSDEDSGTSSPSPPTSSATSRESPAALHLNLHSPPLSTSTDCSSYFVEPLSWMGNTLQAGHLHGKLLCPGSHCAAKLGSFDWAGSQCSCGAWITPAFQILRSKVDEI